MLTPRLGEFRRLYRLRAGKLEPVTPDVKHDVSGFVIDDARRRIVYTVNEDGFTRMHALDARTFKPVKLPGFPPADHVYPSRFSDDGRFLTVGVDTGTAPSIGYVVDWKTGKAVQWQLPSAPEVDLSRFVRATLETYPARDGTPIPMFVRRPAGCAAPCPVVVEFHGGPEGQATPGFNRYAQLLVDAGFVVVEPNVRGSDGYGKTWFHADDGPRRLDIITDIEDASRFIRKEWAVNGVSPKVAIVGGSYGGYSALMGMTMFAGAYDAGVDIVGISNLLTFLENTAPYRRALRVNEYGDPEKDRDALVKLSPVTYIDRVKAPLLIIQGANDPRVPAGEAIQIARGPHRAQDPRLPHHLPGRGARFGQAGEPGPRAGGHAAVPGAAAATPRGSGYSAAVSTIRSRFETTTPPGLSTVTAKSFGSNTWMAARMGTTTSPSTTSNTPPSTG